MRTLIALLVASAAPLAPARAQTEVLVGFDHPGGFQFGWGHALVAVGDLDGDGADELAVGTFRHGGGETATVHSGRTGVMLFRLEAPLVPAFFGDAIVPLSDETGDGLPELAVLGSHSGDANSPEGMILVHSGADGAVLRQVIPPAGVTVHAHLQGNAFSPGDVDGDGSGDLLCRTTLVPGGGQVALTLLSSRSGQPLYSVAPTPPATFVGDLVARLSDHDGDGQDDFAAPVFVQGSVRVQLRSGRTGALIEELDQPQLELLTGNGEPFLGIADLDGDGRRDLGVGAVFDGRVALHSTADGALLRRWGCEDPPAPCFGSRLVEVGDMDGNGRADLVALESNVFGSGGVRIFGLDPTTKARLFDELVPGLGGGYASGHRIAALPGADPGGAPAFALFEDQLGQVSVRRFVPRVGAH